MVYASAARQTHSAMGTVMSHQAFGPNAQESLVAARSEIERLEGLFSRFLPDSEISRINRASGLGPVRVSVDTYVVLSRAVELARRSPGFFDITISPLTCLWTAARAADRVPDEAQIQAALSRVDFQDVILNPERRIAGLRKAGQAVDLGGIGKGYAAQKVLDVFKDFHIPSACSNLGGNVVVLGSKPDGSPWLVGVQHPRRENSILGVVAAVDQAVVTSGDYQRYFMSASGRRCHHILDPLTGCPSQSGLISVTIVTKDATTADALSTMVFVAGLEKGLELLSGCPQTDAILVNSAGEVLVTPGLLGRFQPGEGIRPVVLSS